MPALPAVVLAALLAVQSPLHTFHGDSPGDEFGVSAAFAGDANRDGYADVLVGAHWDDDAGTNSGGARLFSGLDGSVLATFYGDAAGDFFGLSVVGIGDINGDDFEDFAVGADGANANGADSGLVRVISGKTGATLRDIPGAAAGEQIGSALASAGSPSHLILIGAPASNLARVVSATTGATAWTFFGAAAGDGFGTSVASGRDLTGDGVPDYAIGAPNDDVGGTDSGSVAIFSGSNGVLVRTLRGVAAGDRFGTSVALIPDSDGDGRADIVVGAPRADGPGTDAGAAYIFSGASGATSLVLAGEAAGDQFGCSVACLSAPLGTPDPSFAVGARWNDVGGSNAGAAYAYSAAGGGPLHVLRGAAPGDWFGGVVAGAQDVDGDGVGDLLASARLADVNGSDSGSASVFSFAPRNTWYVDASATPPGLGTLAQPYASIQYAVDQPTTVSGDTISIASGTYFENVVIDGKTLALVGAGPTLPLIDGQQAAPCIRIVGALGTGSRLDRLEITNGAEHDPDPVFGTETYGAGVYCPANSVALWQCVVRDNFSVGSKNTCGIGVFASGRFVNVVDCSISGNRELDPWIHQHGNGGGGGGGLSISGVVVNLIDTQIAGNSSVADGSGAVVGGATVRIQGCEIVGNGPISNGTYPNGGGMIVGGGEVSIESCLISGNMAADFAGGVWVTSGSVAIRNCVVEDNLCWNGYEGGGIFAASHGTTVERCIIVGNLAGHGGGTAGPLTAIDSTFMRNEAFAIWDPQPWCKDGGAMWGGTAIRCLFQANGFAEHTENSDCEGTVAADSTLIQCTIVGNDGPISTVTTTAFLRCTLDSCIEWDNVGELGDVATSVTYSNTEAGHAGTGNISLDPLFLGADHGDFHLTALSPCIDAGNPLLPLDPDGSRADMGAFPYDPNYCPGPFIYCTARTNSCGGTPAISFTGGPSAAATSGFVISASGARNNKAGLLMYSPNGQASSPFQGGTLCIAPQGLKRGPGVVSSGGSTPVTCDATFSIDWAAFASGNAGGNPQGYLTSIGQRVNVQWWGRDTLGYGSFLSDAIQYEVCP